MNKIIILFSVISFSSYAQHNCCSVSTTEKFAQVASTHEFASMHLAPVPFNYSPSKGSMITFQCQSGEPGKAFQVTADKPTDKWLFVFHEWWGLNDYIKRETEKLSAELNNVNILAIDLYDGKLATTPDSAQALLQGVRDERARDIISGAIGHTGANAKIGSIGWCFGGGWSLQSALMEGTHAIACIMYYGMPESDVEKLKKLNTDVLGIFASKDGWITPDVVESFKDKMKEAGKKVTVKSYDADHAFANPSNPKYVKTAAEDAHQLVMNYLKERMK